MSIVGIFTKAQPSINELVFDAVISESSEMATEITQFPIETGAIGNDHAVQKPLRISLRLGVSDNVFRHLATQTGGLSSLASASLSAASGKLITEVGKRAVVAGLGGSVANAVYAAYTAGRAETRSQSMLEAVRDLQRSNAIVNVVGAKSQYTNCMIVGTRQEVTAENENGLDLVVDLQQLLIINSRIEKETIPAPNDTAELQAQEIVNIGQVTLQ
jgi:hypothetical protein